MSNPGATLGRHGVDRALTRCRSGFFVENARLSGGVARLFLMGEMYERADSPTGRLTRWEDYQSFFLHLVEWLERPAQPQGLVARLETVGREGRLRVEIDPQRAATLGEPPRVTIVPPHPLEPFALSLGWRGPAQMEARFEMTSGAAYHGIVLMGDPSPYRIPPAVLPYSPEFAPSPSPAQSALWGARSLAALGQATGGQRLSRASDLGRHLEAIAPLGVSARPVLLFAGLLLGLYEIAARRGLATGAWRMILQRRRGLGELKIPVKLAKLAVTKKRDAKPSPPAEPRGAPPAVPAAVTAPAPVKKSAFARAKERSRLARGLGPR